MKIKIVFLLVFQLCFINAQISQKVKALAKPLDTIDYAESSHMGIDGESSIIYGYFKEISKTAKNDELYFFAKNGSNSLRLYSSQELLKRNDKRFLEIYKFYTDNPLIMKYQMGCVGNKENIATYLKREIYMATEIISMRDYLLKTKKDKFIKAQLESIEEEGYDKLTQKNLKFYLRETDKIDKSRN
ncbi:hypothetical protein [Chryseobacterium limigenitum]|nr:hypothetical protein [Chryseobacterium limigenitum]